MFVILTVSDWLNFFHIQYSTGVKSPLKQSGEQVVMGLNQDDCNMYDPLSTSPCMTLAGVRDIKTITLTYLCQTKSTWYKSAAKSYLCVLQTHTCPHLFSKDPAFLSSVVWLRSFPSCQQLKGKKR